MNDNKPIILIAVIAVILLLCGVAFVSISSGGNTTNNTTTVTSITSVTSVTTVVTTITANTCSSGSYAEDINGSGYLSCSTVVQFTASAITGGGSLVCNVNSATGEMVGYAQSFIAQSSSAFITFQFYVQMPANAGSYYVVVPVISSTSSSCGNALPTFITKGTELYVPDYSTTGIGQTAIATITTSGSLTVGNTYYFDLYAQSSSASITFPFYSFSQFNIAY
jgi:hypothetical protein